MILSKFYTEKNVAFFLKKLYFFTSAIHLKVEILPATWALVPVTNKTSLSLRIKNIKGAQHYKSVYSLI